MEDYVAQREQLQQLLAQDPSNAEIRGLIADINTLIEAEKKSKKQSEDSFDLFSDDPEVDKKIEESALAKKRKREEEQATKQKESKQAEPADDDEAETLHAFGYQTAESLKAFEVSVTGTDAPGPIFSFENLVLTDALRRNLSQYYTPTAIQCHSIPIILNKRDLIATAQTGSGKTVAFLLPVLLQLVHYPLKRKFHYTKSFPVYVVLSPTRELAVQIYEQAVKLCADTGIHATVVYGGTSYEKQAQEVEAACDILIATPGRLCDMLQKERVGLTEVRYLCFDEADKMLDMGFEKDIRRIVNESGMPTQRQTLMFSATFAREVTVNLTCRSNLVDESKIRKLAADFLRNYVLLKVGKTTVAPPASITQVVRWTEPFEKMSTLMRELKAVSGRTLVFVDKKKTAGDIAWHLQQKGLKTEAIHGDRTQQEREYALELFKSGKVDVLVATNVAARGLHIDDVAHVINFDLPSGIEDYIHRIGRTGRQGSRGVATSFFCHANAGLARHLLRVLTESGQEIPIWLANYNPASAAAANTQTPQTPKSVNK